MLQQSIYCDLNITFENMFSEQKQKVLTFFILSKIAIIHHPSVVGSSSSSGVILHGGQGGGAGPRLGLGQRLLGHVGTLLGPGQVGLHLAVLGQVEGGDLLGLLDLLLVGLDLALQLVNETLHALVVLLVLVRSEGELLDGPLRLPEILLSIAQSAGLSIHLGLQLPDAGLHLVHGLLSALQSVHLGLVHSGLQVLDLSLHHLLVPFELGGEVLLGAELLGQPGSVNHGAASLLLGESRLVSHLVKISIHIVDLILQLPLSSGQRLVGVGGVGDLLVGVGEVLLQLPPGPVRLLQQTARLLQRVLGSVRLPLGQDKRLLSSRLHAGLLLQLQLSISDLSLVLLQ